MVSSQEWKLLFWESRRGKKPVEDWFLSLPQRDQKRIDRLFTLLQKTGPTLSLPHNKNLGGGIYELRDSGTGPGYRIYYGVYDSYVIILLVAGDKSSQERDILTAKKRFEDKGE